LAVPESVQTCSRGCPEPIDIQKLLTVDVAGSEALIDFCNKYGIEMDAPPTWLLSSYWG